MKIVEYFVKAFNTVVHFLAKTPISRVRFANTIKHRIYRQIQRKHHPQFVSVRDLKIYVPTPDHSGTSVYYNYEPGVTAVVERYIREGDVAFDIGANISWYTMVMAKAVGSPGAVHSFEPDPSNFEFLFRNVRENRFSNVVLNKMSVLNKPESSVRFYVNLIERGQNTFFPESTDTQSILVYSTSLDDYCYSRRLAKVDFIKMDCEGSEGLIIEGAHQLLMCLRDIRLEVECYPDGLKRSGVQPHQLLEELRGLGFKLYRIDRDDGSLHTIEDDDKFVNSIVRGSFENIFCEKVK